MLQALPLGTSDFSSLRVNGEIYVDKTDLVFQLAQYRGKIFLARPRRFGKSLLISTFESLFKKGLQDFHGLAIEKLWQDKTYPVVRLDFSELKEFETAEQFTTNFFETLRLKFSAVGFRGESQDPFLILKLSNWFSSLAPSSLVILIDEYDAPLTACLDKPELFESVRSLMSQFFLTLKANEGCQRFFFMTGITKFSNTSIFSAFNNLQDISLDIQYGTLLGYTENEIITCFPYYLDRAAEALQLPRESLITHLREQYDGFTFDRRAQTHVYCPWSVLNFLAKPAEGFQNYWYSSGGQPTVLLKYLSQHALSQPMDYGESKTVRLSDLNASRQYNEISLDVLLTQAGYYTIREVTADQYVFLAYPNQEVAVSMAQLYADALLKGKRLRKPGQPSIHEVLSAGSIDEVIEQFNHVVHAIDYQRYPIVDEASCRAYLQVLLIGEAMLPQVEVHNALGRSDMEVHAGTRHWVFEFKFASADSGAESLLIEAIQQIKTRQYGVHGLNHELIRVALVFSAKQRRFIAWKQV